MQEMTVPVLIVGGGGCGLSSSMFLSNLGIESLLIERHEKQSPMPKARALNRRTMEVFRQHGFADKVYSYSMPPHGLRKMRWATSLGGDLPTDRTTLFEIDTYHASDDGSEVSPCLGTLYPQVRLEPLMREMAEKQGKGKLAFGMELVELTQDESEVRAVVRNRATDERTVVHAQYVIAADAGKTVGPIIGSRMIGTPDLADMLTVYFRADLSKYIDSDDVMTVWFANPEGDTSSWGSGVLGKLGPTRFGRDSEEWMFHFNFKPDDKNRLQEDQLIPRIRELLKLPDLVAEVLGTSHWIVKGALADRYRFGRVFLAGDAAHRHTPTTGLGLNSAVHDAHNLAWKLAMVLRGHADDALLDTYESERRPVAKRNVDWALFTFSNHPLTGAAIGIVPGDPNRSRANFLALLAESDDGETRRARLREIMEIHRTEFRANDLDIGFHYQLGALVSDGSKAPERDPFGQTYVPTGRPGHRLPHGWIKRGDETVSSLDLVPVGRFVLFVSGVSQSWRKAVESVATQGLPIDLVEIDDLGPCADREANWRRLCGIGQGGALLVRPDQHVAMRVASEPGDAVSCLLLAFEQILKPMISLEEQRRTLRPALSY